MSIQSKFEDFDHAHPEVYAKIVEFARLARQRGFARYGIGSVWERMRWHFNFEQRTSDDFKLNNNFRSRYARKIMDSEPDLEGFFSTRKLRA